MPPSEPKGKKKGKKKKKADAVSCFLFYKLKKKHNLFFYSLSDDIVGPGICKIYFFCTKHCRMKHFWEQFKLPKRDLILVIRLPNIQHSKFRPTPLTPKIEFF